MEPLSSTKNGVKFLSNFSKPRDIEIASLLLDAVFTVDPSTFEAGLQAGIQSVDQSSRDGAIAAYPVLDWSNRRDTTRPRNTNHRKESDSAAIINNLLRRIMSKQHKRVYLPSGRHVKWAPPNGVQLVPAHKRPSAKSTSPDEHPVRTIMFVDDFCGSGQQSLTYLHAWARDPTFRSWRRAGLIDTVYLSFAATHNGSEAIRSLPMIDRCVILYPNLDFSHSGWSPDQLDDVRALCRKHASQRNQALGFGNSEGLFRASHTVANNLPIILRQVKLRGDIWHPAFSGQAGVTTPHQRPAQLDLNRADIGPNGTHAQLIHAVALGSTSRSKLRRSLKATAYEMTDVLRTAEERGLISMREDSIHLTDFGRVELQQIRTQRSGQPDVKDNPRAYYPNQRGRSRPAL